MITFQLRSELAGLVGLGKGLNKQLQIAVNKTLKSTESFMAKEITQEINVTQKVVKKVLVQNRASGNKTRGSVYLSKSSRIELKDFKARQTKKGVSYKISKRSKDRGFIPSGFIVQRYGGNVYVRPGKNRPTGKRKRGPSPWGAFVINEKLRPTVKHTQEYLEKQVRERIRFLTLKKSGAI